VSWKVLLTDDLAKSHSIAQYILLFNSVMISELVKYAIQISVPQIYVWSYIIIENTNQNFHN